MDGTLIALICTAGMMLTIVLGIPFAFLSYRRWLSHKETVAMVEKGLVPMLPETRNGKDALRWGIVIAALGVALCLGLYPLGFVIKGGFPLYFGPWMLIGLIPAFFGMALIVIYLVTHARKAKQAKEQENEVFAGLDDEVKEEDGK